MFKQRSFFSTVFSYYSFLQRFLYRVFSYYSFLLITAGILNNVHFLPAVAWFQLAEACFLRGNTPFFVR